jgi:aminoglycoside 3-N-acetyltransferase
VAEMFRRIPGVLRSDSPHAFAAIGPEAARITADHPWDVPHGLDSPVGRVYELDGQVLLLGVGHDGNTTIHLAESLARVRYRSPKSLTLLEDGRPIRVGYEETDHCCARFALLDEWLDKVGAQQYGLIGNGRARLARSRDIVALAHAHLLADETVFLHEPGIDSECAQARASISETEHRHGI